MSVGYTQVDREIAAQVGTTDLVGTRSTQYYVLQVPNVPIYVPVPIHVLEQ